jgi:hypothetical protein
MKMTFTIFLLIVWTQIACGQNNSQITCRSVYIIKCFNKSVYINNQKLRLDTIAQIIELNNDLFDTLKLERINGEIYISVMKMRNGESYILGGNPCSGQGYELYPEQNGRMGLLRFEKIETDTLIGFVDNFNVVISTDSATKYLRPQLSGMCFFDPKRISVATKEDYQEFGDYYPSNIILRINYNFLHGELLVAKIFPDWKKIELEIEDFIKEGETFEKYTK